MPDNYGIGKIKITIILIAVLGNLIKKTLK